MGSAGPALVALATGVGAFAVWTAIAVAGLLYHREERRGSRALIVVMSWVASAGMLASALGSAAIRGVLDLDLPPDALSFAASFSRGALLAGGIVFFARWRLPR